MTHMIILCHIISSGMIMAIMIGRRKIAVFHWNIYIYVWWVHFPWSGWGTGASLSGFLDLSCYRLDMKNQKKVSIILPSECKAKSYVRNSPRTLKHMLVGGWPTLWKIWKSVGMMTFPIYGKIKAMFQTTNQILLVSYPREKKKNILLL